MKRRDIFILKQGWVTEYVQDARNVKCTGGEKRKKRKKKKRGWLEEIVRNAEADNRQFDSNTISTRFTVQNTKLTTLGS